MKFLLSEILAFTIAVANIFLTNNFLGGEFLNYGPNAIKYLNTPVYDSNNPLNEIFPKASFIVLFDNIIKFFFLVPNSLLENLFLLNKQIIFFSNSKT